MFNSGKLFLKRFLVAVSLQMRSDTCPDGFRASRSVRRRSGFTLIELLVVITILLLLASILQPQLTAAMDSARIAKCASNLRQISTAALTYEVEHNGELPMYFSWNRSKIWYNALPEMLGDKPLEQWNTLGSEHPISLWTCPVQYRMFPGRRTYAINSQLQKSHHPNYAPMTRTQYLSIQVWEGRMPVTPSTMPYFMDGMLFNVNDAWREGRRMTMTGMPPSEELFKAWFPHKSGANVAFLDGHVRLVGVQEPLWADFARRPVGPQGIFAW